MSTGIYIVRRHYWARQGACRSTSSKAAAGGMRLPSGSVRMAEGPGAAGGGPSAQPTIVVARLRAYRLARVQELLRAHDCVGALLSNPVNIRYATDARNMTVWLLHNMGRYCFVPVKGRAVLFEFPNRNCANLAAGLPAIGEVRPAKVHSFFDAGEHAPEVSRQWAAEIAGLVAGIAGHGGSERLAVDRLDLLGAQALRGEGLVLVEGQRLLELARSIKSAEEIDCMRHALAIADIGMQRMREMLAAGITENELWAELHYANIAHGGEWIETRLLCSGPRTNPWFQECSERRIAAGDLVSFDTDLVGPYGYCADVSRTFFCGPGRPSAEQRRLYALAAEQVEFNCNLIRPGLGFREWTQRSWRIPEPFIAQNYGCIAHGVGMVDEWPLISSDARDPVLQHGELVPGMTVCVESYMGEVGGAEGVKLEQQVLVTGSGFEILSCFPLEHELL
jgi:Xaa-Pro dipeptidase